MARACSANWLYCWLPSVTRPVSCGRGLTSLKITCSPPSAACATNSSTPKMPCPPSACTTRVAMRWLSAQAAGDIGVGCQDSR